MSKRVNNKKGNRAVRKGLGRTNNNHTKVRGYPNPEQWRKK